MKKILFLATFIFCASVNAEDKFYFVEDDNAKMDAAMNKAKSTLDHFLQKAKERSTDYDAYGAYIKVKENGETEFLWLVDVKPYDDKYLMGVLISKPRLITSYKYGQTIGFLPSDIYDWQLKNSKTGVITGGYTICAMSDPNKPENVAYLKDNNFDCNS